MSRDRPDDLPGKIAASLDRLARAVRSQRQSVATKHGLTLLQADLLCILADGAPPDPLVGLLALEVGVAQPTVTDSIRALERKGFVKRRSHADDRRRTNVELTSTGMELERELRAADQTMSSAVARLPIEAQEATLGALLGVLATLVDDGVVGVARTCLTCRYYEDSAGVARCALLDAELPAHRLRINCPEHQPA